MSGKTQRVLDAVAIERLAQFKKWDIQRHDFIVWITVLGEE